MPVLMPIAHHHRDVVATLLDAPASPFDIQLGQNGASWSAPLAA